MARNLECSRPSTSTSFVSRLRPDVDPGVFLQRHLFHLRAGIDALLRRPGIQGRRLSSSICDRKFLWPVTPWAFVRHDWSEKNDCSNLWTFRNLARADCLVVSSRTANRTNTNRGVDNHLFHRFSGSELGVSDGESNFAA